jgi:trimethylamine--corrinoid protein Co-methyltransferase
VNTQLFSDSQFEQLADDVRRVLAEVGYVVGHEGLRKMALAAGCGESAEGRILFRGHQVAELRDRLREQYPPPAPDAPEAVLIRPREQLRAGIGNITPKLYDHQTGLAQGGALKGLTDVVKFAQMEPRVVSVGIPLSRQDIDPAVEQLDTIVVMAELTDKPISGLDPTVPETMPYLLEMGEALGHTAQSFISPCNCINPPLRLEARTVDVMLARRVFHGKQMMTTMTNIGGTGPVDVYGSVVLATAEIVGGLILAMVLDPDAPLMGYTATTQLDMRTGNITESSPQTVQVDAGVVQLMDRYFGGGTAVGGRGYITARRPGLQALFERFLKAVGYAGLVDGHALHYVGNGNLDNGSMLSVEQYLLDLEVSEALGRLWGAPSVPAAGDAVERIREGVLAAGGNFLAREHTLSHFRDELWDPTYFQRLTDTKTEQTIVNEAHARYRALVDAYEPTSYPDEVLMELRAVLDRARRALVG